MEKPATNNYIDTNTSEDNWLLQNFDFGENEINSLKKKMEINLKKAVVTKSIGWDKDKSKSLEKIKTLCNKVSGYAVMLSG